MQDKKDELQLEELKKKIETKNRELQKKLSEQIPYYDPIKLLDYSWQKYVENLVTKDHFSQFLFSHSLRCLQSLIVSLKPAPKYKIFSPSIGNQITEDLYKFISQMPSQLFDSDFMKDNENGREYVSQSTLYQPVHGRRYPCHQKWFLDAFLGCQNDIIQDVFDSSAEKLINSLMSFLYHRNCSLHKIAEIMFSSSGREENIDADILFSAETFYNSKIYDIPEKFADALSLSAGEDNLFQDRELLSPYGILPISKSPFLRYNENFYCYSITDLFDNLEKNIFYKIPKKNKKEWIKNRGNALEKEAIKLLKGIFQKSIFYPNIKYSELPPSSGPLF